MNRTTWNGSPQLMERSSSQSVYASGFLSTQNAFSHRSNITHHGSLLRSAHKASLSIQSWQTLTTMWKHAACEHILGTHCGNCLLAAAQEGGPSGLEMEGDVGERSVQDKSC